MPTALITGVLGQDGSLLAELLLDRGYRVVGIEHPDVEPADAERAAVASRSEMIELDLGRPFDATALVARVQPDEVYHLAACHRSSEGKDDPAQQQRMVDVNFSAALALAHALVARGRGALVCACSSQMYTPEVLEHRIDEQAPHAPSTFYGVTKSNCFTAIRWLRERQGLRGSSAILFNHESPRRTATFVSRKITRAAVRIAAKLETALELGDLSTRVDFSSARDVVAALAVMASADRPDDRVVASGQLHSLEELCSVAFTAVGLDWRAHVRSTKPAGERPALVGDPRRIEQDGWTRSRSFQAWIEEMVEADRRLLRDGR
jgi:GDPmannose 4,6-dehydratase